MKDLATLEGKIIKRALSLSKYSSTSAILDALNLGDTVDHLKTLKLSFFIRLLNNSLTRNILSNQLDNPKSLPAKSLLSETMDILGVKHRRDLNLDMLKIMSKTKLDLMTLQKKELHSNEKSVNIRYLLKNRSKQNEEILINILDNFPDRIPGKKNVF